MMPCHSTKPTGKTPLFFLTTPPLLKFTPQKTVFWGLFCRKRKEIPMALLITPSGSVREIHPEYGAACFTTSELHELVDGWLECVHLPDGRLMWINEEGKLRGLPSNSLATLLARSVLRPYDYIAGPAVVTTRQEAGE